MANIGEWTFDEDGDGEWKACEARNAFAVYAYGDFGGGAVTFEYSPDSGTSEIAIADLSITVDGGSDPIRLPPQGFMVRPVLTGATNPDVIVTADELCAP